MANKGRKVNQVSQYLKNAGQGCASHLKELIKISSISFSVIYTITERENIEALSANSMIFISFKFIILYDFLFHLICVTINRKTAKQFEKLTSKVAP